MITQKVFVLRVRVQTLERLITPSLIYTLLNLVKIRKDPWRYSNRGFIAYGFGYCMLHPAGVECLPQCSRITREALF